MTEPADQTPAPSINPAAIPGADAPQATAPDPDPNLVAAGAAVPEGQPQPPTERVSPLVFLAIEQALEFSAEGDVPPFLLGFINEEQKGMWRLPGADEAQMREQLAQLSPRPVLAVSVFDARLEVDGQPRDAFVLEAFDDEAERSATVIQLYSPASGEGESPSEAQALGAPQLYANGENILRG